MKKILFTCISFLIFLNGCGSTNSIPEFPPYVAPDFLGDIMDNDAWYADATTEILEVNVTVPTPNDFVCSPYNDLSALARPCTMVDVYNDADANDDYKPKLHVLMQAGDFVVGNELPNASFYQKGKSTRRSKQKSYRIKLDSETNLFHGERTFQMNKHPYDYSRVRNKLAFDLFETIPNFTSLKTRFVHMMIDENGTGNFVDYGLFTHIEQADIEFLANRGWNKDNNLYKAQNFDFRMTDALLLDKNGEPVDSDAFDERIEIVRGKHHQKFVNMLNEVNACTTDAQFEIVF
ncbi:MAG: hypothetical protein GXO30_01620, partial [Epsilonproteobacteria bacterium]|nr:hypothetical protein [Campylobacterota bacterium]